MSILLVGANGSMGLRYQAILRYLHREFVPVDVGHSLEEVVGIGGAHDGVVLATPTSTHAEFIRALAPLKKPILCEKPVTKSIAELKELFEVLKKARTPFRMMHQYQMLADTRSIGDSFYNYFRHGSDGLSWDCMQVIAIARSKITLHETSPIWMCKLNGRTLHLNHMDAAYVAYVQRWFLNPSDDFGRLLEIHEKTAAHAEGVPYRRDHERLHRDSGAFH